MSRKKWFQPADDPKPAGKHSGKGTGNKNQPQGKHVDTTRQPSGRKPGWIDRIADDWLEGR